MATRLLDSLNDDCLIEILSRLPASTVFNQARLVCRRWLGLMPAVFHYMRSLKLHCSRPNHFSVVSTPAYEKALLNRQITALAADPDYLGLPDDDHDVTIRIRFVFAHFVHLTEISLCHFRLETELLIELLTPHRKTLRSLKVKQCQAMTWLEWASLWSFLDTMPRLRSVSVSKIGSASSIALPNLMPKLSSFALTTESTEDLHLLTSALPRMSSLRRLEFHSTRTINFRRYFTLQPSLHKLTHLTINDNVRLEDLAVISTHLAFSLTHLSVFFGEQVNFDHFFAPLSELALLTSLSIAGSERIYFRSQGFNPSNHPNQGWRRRHSSLASLRHLKLGTSVTIFPQSFSVFLDLIPQLSQLHLSGTEYHCPSLPGHRPMGHCPVCLSMLDDVLRRFPQPVQVSPPIITNARISGTKRKFSDI